MFGRVSANIMALRRSNSIVKTLRQNPTAAAFAFTTTCCTAVAAHNFNCYAFPVTLLNPNTTKLENKTLHLPQNITNNDTDSLVLPTLEASVRAWRLLRTAFLVVLDYEWSKIDDIDIISSVGSTLGLSNTDDENNDKIQRRYWEEETERRKKELELAQTKYTTEKDERGQAAKKLQAEQKDEMNKAAERLCEAQEQLSQIGDLKSIVHRKAATRLLDLCRLNGGAYIKIGQHLANLDYLIPTEYIEVLHSLFDDTPTTSYDDVCQVIREELGKHPDELFDSFEKEPLASASLAQVHMAIDKETGSKLAVKVQHRGLRETSAGDIFAVTTVVRTIKWLFPEFSFGWIADEIAPHLFKELDFCNEGRNSEIAADHLEKLGIDYCVIPKVFWEQTRPRVLCMQFEEGFKATDIEALNKAGLKKRDVAKMVSSVFNAQVFLGGGWVHCDPHPANVLIRANNGKPEMVLVDHGLYKQIDNDFRIRYANLWKALMLADLGAIKESCKSLGVGEMAPLFSAMLTSRPFDEMIERSKTGSLSTHARPDSKADKVVIAGYANQYLDEIMSILDDIPRQMLLLLKMNDCLRHIDYALGSPANTLVIAGKYAARAVYEDQRLHTPSSYNNRKPSVMNRFINWMDYVRVLMRIKLYDISIWWVDPFPLLRATK